MTLIDARHTFGHVSALFATDAVVAQGAASTGWPSPAPSTATTSDAWATTPRGPPAQGVDPAGGLRHPGALRRPVRRAHAGPWARTPSPSGSPPRATSPSCWTSPPRPSPAGKVMVARDKHEQLPPNSTMDRDGRPTTDPNALSQGGALLPFGGHKGYALSADGRAALQRARPRAGRGRDRAEAGRRAGRKVFFCAVDSRRLRRRGPGRRRRRLRRSCGRCPRRRASSPCSIPGEPERRSAERRLAEGIPVAEDTWKAVGRRPPGWASPSRPAPGCGPRPPRADGAAG